MNDTIPKGSGKVDIGLGDGDLYLKDELEGVCFYICSIEPLASSLAVL